MKTRTFQEIYDFCRTDDTYRSYFEASDESRITGARARKYYYSASGRFYNEKYTVSGTGVACVRDAYGKKE